MKRQISSASDEPVAQKSLQIRAPRFLIEDIFPAVDGGQFPVKRVAGEPVEVWADIVSEGHGVWGASLLWRAESESDWRREAFELYNNDRWQGTFTPFKTGRYLFAIEAWTDQFATWQRDASRKREAGQVVDLDAREGRNLLSQVRRLSENQFLIKQARMAFDCNGDIASLLGDDLRVAMSESGPREDVTRSALFPLVADRAIARASAWYEMFPRSQSPEPGRHGTFDDCIARLPDIAAMGFNVLYLPPIHPIGQENRKGRNNSLLAKPGDPGSPYAIGSSGGGHDAVHPELGTLEGFRRLVDACEDYGIEVALDFAIQCSPDHPWLAEHPQWFKRRADGTIRYAENPPKKYEDIVNPDFYGPDRTTLWAALRDVVLFWVEQGVRIFRVDNPHTKPFPFWEWIIRDVQSHCPEVVFLSEAFTRPKVMKALAKIGFTQSYTYFTWRITKEEIQAYLSELTRYPEREYFRPNFFVSTPDILPFHLQSGDPFVFKARFALASALSSNYGILNGYELLEHESIPGKEEYANSEKYELKTRDWNAPGNIKSYIARFNALRQKNAALLQTSNLRFVTVDDDDVTGFVKESADHSNVVAVAIALGERRSRTFWFHLGDLQVGPDNDRQPVREVENLITGERHIVEWGGIRLTIGEDDPALLFRCYR
jgi:starch synthase (maltosyl-transferring)